MDKAIKRFGKLRVSSFFIIGIGVVLCLLTPLLHWLWGIDAQLYYLGLIFVLVGVLILIPRNPPETYGFVVAGFIGLILGVILIWLGVC